MRWGRVGKLGTAVQGMSFAAPALPHEGHGQGAGARPCSMLPTDAAMHVTMHAAAQEISLCTQTTDSIVHTAECESCLLIELLTRELSTVNARDL